MAQSAARVVAPRVLRAWMLGKNSKNNVSHMQTWEP